MRPVWQRARALTITVLTIGAALVLAMLATPVSAWASGLPDARGAWTFDEGAGPWQSAGTDGALLARLESAAQAQKSDVAALGQIVRLGDGSVGEVRVPSALDASAGDFTQPVTSDLTLSARWERVDAGEEPGGEPGEQPGNGQPGDQPGSGDRPGDDAPGADRPSVDRPATDDRPAGSARPSDSASGTLPTTGDPALAAAVPAALAAAALLASRALKR